jgi:hypothetical protein
VTLNRQHPLFDELAEPGGQVERTRRTLELVLLAAARAEVRGDGQRGVLTEFRQRWGSALAAFLS